MFNAEARWDRPLPRDNIMPGNPVNVVASFKEDRFFPLWFFLHGDRHLVKKVQFIWQERKGREKFYLFSVTDTYDTQYTLCFLYQSMRWLAIEEKTP
jgi:hypothetical protein